MNIKDERLQLAIYFEEDGQATAILNPQRSDTVEDFAQACACLIRCVAGTFERTPGEVELMVSRILADNTMIPRRVKVM